MKEYLGDLTKFDYVVAHFVFPFAWKILGAFAVWFLGGIAVRAVQKLLTHALQRRNVDPTLVHYANSTLGLILKALLVLSILGIFGIETTSFSAILAAAGVAIGVAWSGLLANFAAGVFLVILRPFKVGDTISGAGITGTVREIGLFATSIDNGDNLRMFVPNNKLFSDNILNYSANTYRMLSVKVQLARNVDPFVAIKLLSAELQNMKTIPPAPVVSGTIAEFNTLGVVINLTIPCHQSVFANVTAEANQIVFDTLKAANFPAPEARTVWIQEAKT